MTSTTSGVLTKTSSTTKAPTVKKQASTEVTKVTSKIEPDNIKKIVHRVAKLASVTGILLLAFKLFMVVTERQKVRDEIFKTSNCPPLLSVAKSWRDTLIVMKTTPLCNQYVLENLE